MALIDEGLHPAQPLPWPSGRFDGRESFRTVIRHALQSAALEGWSEIILSDATFEDWPLAERVVVDRLSSWSRTGRRMVLVAHDWGHVSRHFARLVNWRRQWAHILDCRRCANLDPTEFPSAIWSAGWMMQRLDLENCRGVYGGDPQRRLSVHEALREVLRQSSPGFPSHTLGL